MVKALQNGNNRFSLLFEGKRVTGRLELTTDNCEPVEYGEECLICEAKHQFQWGGVLVGVMAILQPFLEDVLVDDRELGWDTELEKLCNFFYRIFTDSDLNPTSPPMSPICHDCVLKRLQEAGVEIS